ncbi:MAG TPA: hypothetical protein VMN37_01990 [Gemmatimonadales bacterium]|nr:hypothetical protein [Gemmatimonadales bacterium]
MMRRGCMAAVWVVTVVGCEQATETSGEAGGVALEIAATSGGRVLDSGRVHVVGPTTRVVRATPGSEVTIDQLQPGSYTVSLQGTAGDEVERFGRTAGVQVVAGQNTPVTVTFNPFQPVLAPFAPDTTVGHDVTVAFGALADAASYEVEVAAEEAFTAVLGTATAAASSIPVTLPDFGDFFVRVRAVDPFDGRGVPSAPQPIRSVKPVVQLLSCGFEPGGDNISRGVYIPSFPGSALSQVDLFFTSTVAADYTLQLVARGGAYDGPVIGVAEATVGLPGTVGDNVQTAFLFPSPAVAPGSTVTFAIFQTGGPAASIFYATPNADADCAQIVETNDTSPPLSSFRRQGMGMILQGRAP